MLSTKGKKSPVHLHHKRNKNEDSLLKENPKYVSYCFLSDREKPNQHHMTINTHKDNMDFLLRYCDIPGITALINISIPVLPILKEMNDNYRP